MAPGWSSWQQTGDPRGWPAPPPSRSSSSTSTTTVPPYRCPGRCEWPRVGHTTPQPQNPLKVPAWVFIFLAAEQQKQSLPYMETLYLFGAEGNKNRICFGKTTVWPCRGKMTVDRGTICTIWISLALVKLFKNQKPPPSPNSRHAAAESEQLTQLLSP